MTTPALPIFHALLTTPGDRWFQPYSPGKITRLDDALDVWFAARTAGTIDNPKFVEAKSTISRALEEAWGALERDSKVLMTIPEADRNALDNLPSPNLSNLAGRQRRVEKAADGAMRTAALSLLVEIEPLAEAYAFLRAHTVKRVIRTEEEREATKFTPPPSSSTAVAQVRVVLEKAIDRTYQGLVDRRKNANRSLIETYLIAQKKSLADPETAEESYSPTAHFTIKTDGRRRVVSPEAVVFLHKVLDSGYAQGSSFLGTVYSASARSYEKSDALATKDAKDIRDQFLFKNLAKLTPLLEAKGDTSFASIREIGEFNLERLEGDFQIDFTDDSGFRLHNAVVFVTNQYDTSFCRFPTTFHDVRMPSGEPMPSPSEERMHTVFTPVAAAAGKTMPNETKSKPRRR